MLDLLEAWTNSLRVQGLRGKMKDCSFSKEPLTAVPNTLFHFTQ